jgi:hypothetical protein
MPQEFGTGLRAHIQRLAAPADVPEVQDEDEPQRDEHASTAAIAAEYAERVAELDGRERMLAAAGAELAFRERRLLEREASLETAAQRMSSEMVNKLFEAEPVVDDELARVRARRVGGIA